METEMPVPCSAARAHAPQLARLPLDTLPAKEELSKALTSETIPRICGTAVQRGSSAVHFRVVQRCGDGRLGRTRIKCQNREAGMGMT